MDLDQNQLAKAKAMILEAARRRGRLWYSELYSAIGLDHTNPGDRFRGSQILGAISRETMESDGVMLSALVNGMNSGAPAEGFYELAQELGKLSSDATEDEKLAFWVQELNRCHIKYGV